METRTVLLTAMLVFLPMTQHLDAGGFNLTEQGARAIGMGYAYTAQADDPSAVYYNPAGIVQLDGTQIAICLAAYEAGGKFTSDSHADGSPLFKPIDTWPGKTTRIDNNLSFSPHFFATRKASDAFSVGIGVFSNFGLVNKWPSAWEGRYILGGVEAGLKTVTVNPVVAWRPMNNIALAAGPNLQHLDFRIISKFPGTPDADLDVSITGDHWAWGWNIALMYWLREDLKIGVSYRSAIRQRFSGELRVSGIPSIGANTDVTMPPVCWSGIAWTIEPVTLAFDIHWVGWSTFDVIAVDLSSPLYGVSRIASPEKWKDTLAYRLGASYRLNRRFELLAGLSRDRTPVRSAYIAPMLPANDYTTVNGGVSVHFSRFTLTAACAYVHSSKRAFNNVKGDYYAAPLPATGRITGDFHGVRAYLIGLDVVRRF